VHQRGEEGPLPLGAADVGGGIGDPLPVDQLGVVAAADIGQGLGAVEVVLARFVDVEA
jgi:hypothetical protein